MSKEEVYNLVYKQINNLFVIDEKYEGTYLYKGIDIAWERLQRNLSFNKNKYYSQNNRPYFNPFHSGQYTIFLYYLSNSIYKLQGSNSLSDKLYYLNKVLNSVDLFYEVELPDIFFLEHPVGTVIGRAEYSNYFCFSQNCTVGNNKGIYPKFGEFVTMHSGSKIIGNTSIGSYCVISANSYIKDETIPDNCLVFGSSPNIIIKQKEKEEMLTYFEDTWKGIVT